MRKRFVAFYECFVLYHTKVCNQTNVPTAERTGIRKNSESLCLIKSEEQCCTGSKVHKGDGICWGCNPVLLEMAISCEDQPTELEMSNSDEEMAHWRDCSCNSNCILYDNCCQDFQDTCPHFYEGECFLVFT